jgi:cytochrome c peroxidase
LRLTDQETDALIAFLKTTAGTNVYIDPKWSNPFLD